MLKTLTKRKIMIFSLILLSITLPIFYLVNKYQKKVEARWWNDNWMYRRAVNISNSSGSNLTDFQVSFTLDTASLISAGKMQSDCDDIRITDVNGKVLPHWIEKNNPGCNNSSTKIWTKVPLIPTSGVIIYVYYGNAFVNNIEKGDNVFEFFDDFENGNLNKWDLYDNGVNISNDDGNKVVELETYSGNWIEKARADSSWINYKVTFRVKLVNPGPYGYRWSISGRNNGTTGVEWGTHTGNTLYFRQVGTPNLICGGSYTWSPGWYNTAVAFIGNNIKGYIVDLNNPWRSCTQSLSSYGGISFSTWDAGSKIYIDNVLVTKSASTEPSPFVSSIEEQSQSPVAYWKFDEGAGNTTYDSSPNKNNGTITGAIWQTEDLCIAGKCLKFDGVDDYVGIGSTANDIKTVSFWVKTNINTTGLIGLSASAYISVSSGTITTTGFSSPTIYVNGKQSTTLETNKWQHVVVTTNTGITGSAITLGKASSSFLQGFLDEVKIYNYARTPAQIKAEYNAGKSKVGSNKGSAVVMGAPDKGINLSDGLVGYWKMDELSWTNNCSTQTVIDSSGNGNHGKSCPSGSGPTGGAQGRFGKGGEFNTNLNQYIYIGDYDSLSPANITIASWIKWDGNRYSSASFRDHAAIVSKGAFNLGEYVILMRRTEGFSDTNIGVYINSSLVLTWPNSSIDTKWHHLVSTFNGNIVQLFFDGILVASANVSTSIPNTSLPFLIANQSLSANYYWGGILDEVRIYNRALSPAEVRALYEWAPGPVAHFKLDEGSGNSPVDSSGFGRISSIINGIWSLGKFGKGLKLDGSGDYLEINDF